MGRAQALSVNAKQHFENLGLTEEGRPDTVFKSSSGINIAKGYNRVVYGGRGPYIEFERHHFTCALKSKYGNSFDSVPKKSNYYYVWVMPEKAPDIKIYYQIKKVKYADYRLDRFYVDPYSLLIYLPQKNIGLF